MQDLKGRPTAKEVAQGFFISLASDKELIDAEKTLILDHGIDENKYRWETRYLSVAATEYAFYSLREGKFSARARAVREEYWTLWKEFQSKDEESAFVVAQCRARLELYAPAIDKDASGAWGAFAAHEFARQFGSVSDMVLLLLENAGIAVFDGTLYAVTEMLGKLDVEI